MAKDVEGWRKSLGYRAYLIPDNGSMRVTRPVASIDAAKHVAQTDIDDMLLKCSMIEMVIVKDRTAIEHQIVRRIG